jgi:small redox-active disulfide protein 2
MKIKVLGTGCSKCKTLEKMTRETIAELGIVAEIEKVEDIVAIMGYGVMTTPAIVIDEKVVLKGRIPTIPQLKEILLTQY